MAKSHNALLGDIELYIREEEYGQLDRFIEEGGNADDHIVGQLDEYVALRGDIDRRIIDTMKEVEDFLGTVNHIYDVDGLSMKVRSLREEVSFI